ncbi:MAG: hydrolase [Pseudomonadota bacterium]
MIVQSHYKPPWWFQNKHLQTLFPAILRCTASIELIQEQFELSDGDFIDLFWTTNRTVKNIPIMIVLHGLEGSIKSPYTKGILSTIERNNWCGVLMHFRGCSGRHNRLARSYHSGETNDLHSLIIAIKERYPDSPLTAIGFSLGGNVLLKYLGEQQDQSLLSAAFTVSVPFDLADGASALGKGFSRIYQWHLLKHIREKMKDKFKYQKSPIELTHIDKWNDFFTFDDRVTAPLHGFTGVNDYYTKSSSKQFLKKIKTPTHILHSKDDPFMSFASIPVENELSNSVTIELSEKGGHVGFFYLDKNKCPAYWAEKSFVDFMQQQLADAKN